MAMLKGSGMKQPNNPYDYSEYFDAPDGKLYHWDPDFQQWIHVLRKEEYDALSHWEKYNWIYASIILTALCFLVS